MFYLSMYSFLPRVKPTVDILLSGSLSDIVLPIQKGKGKGKGKGTKRGNADSNASSALKDFTIEYAKSSRAACRVCEIKIAKVIEIVFHFCLELLDITVQIVSIYAITFIILFYRNWVIRKMVMIAPDIISESTKICDIIL